MLAHQLPDTLRSRQMHYCHALDGLAKQQRLRLRGLLEVLPLQLVPPRHGAAASLSASSDGGAEVQAQPHVTICGLRLPDRPDVVPATQQEAQVIAHLAAEHSRKAAELMSSWNSQLQNAGQASTMLSALCLACIRKAVGCLHPEAITCLVHIHPSHQSFGLQELGTALGHLVRFLDLLAYYQAAPLLHQTDYQGSTPSIWMARSFWDHGPGRALHRLHLSPEQAASFPGSAAPPAQ